MKQKRPCAYILSKFTVWNVILVLLTCGGDKPKQSNGDDTSGGKIVADMLFGTHSYCDHFIYLNDITVGVFFLLELKQTKTNSSLRTTFLPRCYSFQAYAHS